MEKFTRYRVDSPEYAKNPDNFFATYFRRVALTYMEIESSLSDLSPAPKSGILEKNELFYFEIFQKKFKISK